MTVTRKDEYGTDWTLELLEVKRSETTTVERLVDPTTQRPVVFISVAAGSKMMMPSIKEGVQVAGKKADEIFATVCERAGAK